MEIFTWWDARGRRLPWLIALVVLVGGGYAAVEASAETPAPVAHAAGVVPLAKVFVRSGKDAQKKCDDDELMTRLVWHCEGAWGGKCKRPWLTRPNYVSCGDVDAFWDKWDGSDSHRVCKRRALYYAGANGTSSLKLVKVGTGGKRWATSAWACSTHLGG